MKNSTLFFRKIGSGPPLVILHGLFGSSDNWLTVSKLFASEYEVFLIDQRNHGQSPHENSHTYEEMAHDLKAFLEENQIFNPILVGHSMGGKTAMKFVELYPNQIKNLIVVDIAPKHYPPHHQREINALQSIDLKKLTNRQEADDLMAKHIPELGVRQFLLKNLYRTEDGAFHWRMNLELLINKIDNIGEQSNDFKTSIPTLFIKGENSNYIKSEDEKLISSIFNNATIISIPNAGHWVQAEQPQAFKEAVYGFIK